MKLLMFLSIGGLEKNLLYSGFVCSGRKGNISFVGFTVENFFYGFSSSIKPRALPLRHLNLCIGEISTSELIGCFFLRDFSQLDNKNTLLLGNVQPSRQHYKRARRGRLQYQYPANYHAYGLK